MASCPPQENEICLGNEEWVLYKSRHKHELCLMKGIARYTCSGCKAFGANIGYKCQSCPDFVLHEACAVLPDEYVHPFFRQHPFKFCLQMCLRHRCDGCGEVIRGSVFESRGANLKLHPLCMALPTKLSCNGHKDHDLKLVIDVSEKYDCTKCKKQGSKWRYLCEMFTCELKLDMNCAIVDYHGLSDHGITRLQRPSRSDRIRRRFASGSKGAAKVAIRAVKIF